MKKDLSFFKRNRTIIFCLWASVTLFGVGVVFTTAANLAFAAPKLFLFRISMIIAVLLLLRRWIREKQVFFISTKVPWFAVIFLFILCLRGYFFDVPFLSQVKTLEYVGWLFFILLIWLALSADYATMSKNAFHALMNVSLTILEALGLCIVFYGFIQHFGWDPIRWDPGGRRIFSTLQNADAFATFLGSLIALSLIRFLYRPRFLRGILLLSEISALYWSYTRAPFLALGIAGLLLLAATFAFKSLRFFAWRLSVTFIMAAALFFFLMISSQPVVERYRFIPAQWKSDTSVIGRKYLFKKGVEVLMLHPWHGVGPGNFSYAYLQLRNDNPSFYKTRLAIGESTHNTFLDIFVETGWIGGAIFLAIWISSFIALFSALKNSNSEESALILAFFLPLLVAFISLQFTYPDTAIEAFTGFLIGAGPFVCPSNKVIKVRFSFRVAAGILILAFVFCLSGVVYSTRTAIADLYAGSGRYAVKDELWKNGVEKFNLATIWDPWNPLFYQKLGKAYESLNNPKQALLNYNKARRINDKNPYIWADIGRLAGLNHWRKRALIAYAKAIEIDPYNPNWYHDAAYTALNLKAFPMALYCAREAFSLNPEEPSNALFFVESLLATGHTEEGTALLKEQLKKFPGDPGLIRLQEILNQ